MGRVRKGRDIDVALCRKGFRRKLAGKHIQYFLSDSAEIRTMMSHGDMGITIDSNLLSRMARQLRLTKVQFLNLIDCTLDENGYCQLLKSST
jgi:hypothetical protein